MSGFLVRLLGRGQPLAGGSEPHVGERAERADGKEDNVAFVPMAC